MEKPKQSPLVRLQKCETLLERVLSSQKWRTRQDIFKTLEESFGDSSWFHLAALVKLSLCGRIETCFLPLLNAKERKDMFPADAPSAVLAFRLCEDDQPPRGGGRWLWENSEPEPIPVVVRTNR